MYPLGKAEFCSKLLIFLRPLALVPSERVHLVQISTLPLSVDLLHEGLCVCVCVCVCVYMSEGVYQLAGIYVESSVYCVFLSVDKLKAANMLHHDHMSVFFLFDFSLLFPRYSLRGFLGGGGILPSPKGLPPSPPPPPPPPHDLYGGNYHKILYQFHGNEKHPEI